MRIFGLIPARGGSKGIPGKNLRTLGGKSLVQRAWESAIGSGVVERVILSTDSEEIAAHGRSLGIEVPFLRPADIAQDNTPMIAVLKHLLDHLHATDSVPDAIVLLQPTAPLRRPEHLQEAANLLQDGVDSVVSVSEVPQHFSPHFLMKITSEGHLTYFMPDGSTVKRRQDAPRAYSRNGAVYLFRVSSFEKHQDIYGENCIPLLIPPDETINLDTMEDWERAERYFAATAP
jgi:CMP-N,N'-diacetyllegionaminic acid synthase